MIKHFYTKKALSYCKFLRNNATDSEKLLWYYLKKKQMGGFKFRRQQPIGPYIVDFYCASVKLIVELDGSLHNHQKRKYHDLERDKFLSKEGHTILRIQCHEIFRNSEGVLETIWSYLTKLCPSNMKND